MGFATRYLEAIAAANINSETIAKALLKLFSRVDLPKVVLSDNGSKYVAKTMEKVVILLYMHQVQSFPYHSMVTGLVEKWNGTLKRMLRRICSER